MAGTINPSSLPGGRQRFFERMPLARYVAGSNPRTDGTMNVADATNAGHTVMPWVPSSGAGPGTYGYRGSFGGGVFGRGRYGGYQGGSGDDEFKTKRPTAKNSDEYYSKRDATIGNPLTMLKMNGPGRFNLMQSIMNEVRGKGASSASGEMSGPPKAGVSSGMEYSDEDHSTSIGTDGRSRLISRWGKGSNVPVEAPKPAESVPDPLRLWKTQVMGPSRDLASKEIEGPSPEPAGPPSPSILSSVIEKRQRQQRADELAKVDAEMSQGTFTPGGRSVSRAGEFADAIAIPIGRGAGLAYDAIVPPINKGAEMIVGGAYNTARKFGNFLFKPRFVQNK